MFLDEKFKLYWLFHSAELSDVPNFIDAFLMGCATRQIPPFIPLSAEFGGVALWLARVITTLFCVKCVSEKWKWGGGKGAKKNKKKS